MTAEAKKKGGGPEHIGSILSRALERCRTSADAELMRIWDVWNAAVGPSVAENAWPEAVKGRIVLVGVSGSTWIHHLRFMKTDLIQRVNDALGKPMVGEMKFKVGCISDASSARISASGAK